MKHHAPQALKAFLDNYIWTLRLTYSNHFLVVDPGDADVVIRFAKLFNLDLKYILLTHYHYDHIGGVEKLKTYFSDVIVYGLKELEDFNSQLIIGGLKFNILLTPGHTKDDICFLEENKGWLFCGDTLFSAGCGRVFDGKYEQLFASIRLLSNLPSQTEVYCAHEYTLKNLKFANLVEPSNKDVLKLLEYYQNHPDEICLPSRIGIEKKINPFFRLNSIEIINYLKVQGFDIDNDIYSVFKSLRLLRNKY